MVSKLRSKALEPSGVHTMVTRSYGGMRVKLHDLDRLDVRSILADVETGSEMGGEVMQEGRVGDLVGTYLANVYLISEHFRRCLLESGLAGWHTTPVRLTPPHDGLKLWLLGAHGRCGPIYGVGGRESIGLPSIGQFLDPVQWDGTDFFVPDNQHAIYISAASALMIGQSGLRNVRVESAGLEALPTQSY